MSNEQAVKIQEALFTRGYLVGEVDGVWGRRTIAAVRLFQAAEGLQADGILGPKTASKLFPLNGEARYDILLPWIAEAQHLTGLSEVPGPKSSPELIEMATDLEIDYDSDDIPWCGLFVAHCIGATLPDEVLPAAPLSARAWLRFGDATKPRAGAVMVFWREAPTSWKGHVAFYIGETEDRYIVLGGNQDNTVKEKAYRKERLLSARWPRTGTSLAQGGAIASIEISHGLAPRPQMAELSLRPQLSH